MKAFWHSVATFFLLLCSLTSFAAPTFPELTGRIVDSANLISSDVEVQLGKLLADHESGSSNQLVVVTLPSLQGYPIEDFGYQLGRHWGIGQKEKNNGALLIVAPVERAVRIEVGYGLEGVLTDALSHDIVQNRILPQFKQGNFEQGILDGISSIIRVSKNEYTPESVAQHSESGGDFLSFHSVFQAAFFGIFLSQFIGVFIRRRPLVAVLTGGITFVVAIVLGVSFVFSVLAAGIVMLLQLLFTSGGGGGGGYGGSSYGGSYRSGSFGGGGFSGGGGSFGGGGASGRW